MSNPLPLPALPAGHFPEAAVPVHGNVPQRQELLSQEATDASRVHFQQITPTAVGNYCGSQGPPQVPQFHGPPLAVGDYCGQYPPLPGGDQDDPMLAANPNHEIVLAERRMVLHHTAQPPPTNQNSPTKVTLRQELVHLHTFCEEQHNAGVKLKSEAREALEE